MGENKEYHKIQSLFKRDPATKYRTFLDEYTCPEFAWLQENEWLFEEKVDGTNIRVHWDGERVRFGGRTDNAQTPTFLINKLQEMFPPEKLEKQFDFPATLYGEGYGAKIQKGGGDYIKDGCSFILFDVRCGDFWLTRKSVAEVAEGLDILSAPIIKTGTLSDAVSMCKYGFESYLRTTPPEGLIIRPPQDLFLRDGSRLITKLKLKDFN